MQLKKGGARRLAGWMLFFIILFSNYFQSSESPQSRRPSPISQARMPDALPEGAGKLKGPSRFDGSILIESDERQPHTASVGTAFSINDDGLWITARHVTDGCDELYLRGVNFKSSKIDGLIQHPRSDVSLFRTAKGAEPLLVNFTTPEYGQKGYHFGFPGGKPGDVYSELIGRRIIRHAGARSNKENVLVWAEKDSYPRNDLSLGGISGGPIVDIDGAVVGIHVAGSLRRGRSYSSLPATIQYLSNKSGQSYDTANDLAEVRPYLTNNSFAKAGAKLRKQNTVAQVICLVK